MFDNGSAEGGKGPAVADGHVPAVVPHAVPAAVPAVVPRPVAAVVPAVVPAAVPSLLPAAAAATAVGPTEAGPDTCPDGAPRDADSARRAAAERVWLARLAADAEVDTRLDRELTGLQVLEQQAASVFVAQGEALLALWESTPSGGPVSRQAHVLAEAGWALNLNEMTVGGRLGVAIALGEHPLLAQLLRAGRLGVAHALVAVQEVEALGDPGLAARVLAQVLTGQGRPGWPDTPSRLRVALRRAAVQLDPEGAARRRLAETERLTGVRLRAARDGLADWTATGPATQLGAAHQLLDLLSGSAGPADARSRGQRQIDALLGALVRQAGSAVPVELQLQIGVQTTVANVVTGLAEPVVLQLDLTPELLAQLSQPDPTDADDVELARRAAAAGAGSAVDFESAPDAGSAVDVESAVDDEFPVQAESAAHAGHAGKGTAAALDAGHGDVDDIGDVGEQGSTALSHRGADGGGERIPGHVEPADNGPGGDRAVPGQTDPAARHRPDLDAAESHDFGEQPQTLQGRRQLRVAFADHAREGEAAPVSAGVTDTGADALAAADTDPAAEADPAADTGSMSSRVVTGRPPDTRPAEPGRRHRRQRGVAELLGHGPVDDALLRDLLDPGVLPAGLGQILIRRLLVDRDGQVVAVDANARPLQRLLSPRPSRAGRPGTSPGSYTGPAAPGPAARLLGELLTGLPEPPPTVHRRRPSAAQNRVVRLRDVSCCFPGCGRRAENDDLDHRLRWPEGPTSVANLHALCRRHHRLKHDGWKASRHPDGGTTWTSPRGQQRHRPPP